MWNLTLEIRGAFDDSCPSLVSTSNGHIDRDEQPVGGLCAVANQPHGESMSV